MSKDNPTRRKVLKGIGVGTVGAPVLMGRVAAKRDREVSAEEAGITQAVERLFENRKQKQAIQLLKEHNVGHDHDTVSHRSKSSQTDDDEISTNTIMEKSKSDFHLNGWHSHGDTYTIRLTWDLAQDDNPPPNWDIAPPEDGCGLSWVDEWEFEPGTLNHDDHTGNTDIQHDGVLGRFDDLTEWVGLNTYGWLACDLEKQYSGKHTVYGHYSHTWSVLQDGGIGFGISLGVLSVTWVGSSTNYWKINPSVIEI